MTCPSRQYCADPPRGCGEELIHRDHRKPWESSSGLGQIISRDGPRGRCSSADLDQVWYQGDVDQERRSLLRLIEHKEPSARIKGGQQHILALLAAIIDFALHAPDAPVRLTPSSGVFVVRGRIDAETQGHRKTVMHGPQGIWRVDRRTRWLNDAWPADHIALSHAEFFTWMTAGYETAARATPAWWPLRTP